MLILDGSELYHVSNVWLAGFIEISSKLLSSRVVDYYQRCNCFNLTTANNIWR